MIDLLFVAVMVAFFLLAMAFVRACDHLVGPDVTSAGRAAEESEPGPAPERQAA